MTLEQTITKDILKNKLYSGEQPAADLLYTCYGGMLFSYILQFVPDRREGEDLLVNIFSRLATRLQEACDSNLSIYCWLQIEARKIILEHPFVAGQENVYYFSLLNEATQEHRWVFKELFLHGRQKEEVALQVGKEPAYIGGLLRECLLIIRKKLG